MTTEELTQVKWEEPQPSKRNGSSLKSPGKNSMRKYEGYVESLKTSPNRWSLFKESASPTYSTRLKAAFPGVETTCRRIKCDDGKQRFNIYARWVG